MSKNASSWWTTVVFFGFIAGKLVGGYIATWSWWWVLLPIVPILGTLIHRFLL